MRHHKDDDYFKRLKITNGSEEVEKWDSKSPNKSINWYVHPEDQGDIVFWSWT